jgi:2-dehydro-3-deoxy-D-arabinonate dehydratase
MKLYRTMRGPVVEASTGTFYLLDFPDAADWDRLLNLPDLGDFLAEQVRSSRPGDFSEVDLAPPGLLPPIVRQEVWAAGVTYHRSRDARMEESEEAGAADFYSRVYDAARPELFLKATPHRVVGHGQPVRIRADSNWNVPEPELTLVINSAGRIVGFTIGNDMSSRDIEGENPLYLPQAKVYDQCCALGPGILVTDEFLPVETAIRLSISRDNTVAFEGATSLARLKRTPGELVEYLFRENSFPHGCFLLTGTGIVPPNEFALQSGDEIRITIDPIGTLFNRVL